MIFSENTVRKRHSLWKGIEYKLEVQLVMVTAINPLFLNWLKVW